MLPPKRSTRSAHVVSQTTQDAPAHVHHVQQLNLAVSENSSSPPVETWSCQSHFEVNTPQAAKPHQYTQADSAQKKARRKLTASQRLALEDLASRGNNPSLEARRALAVQIDLELKVISVWFQNKRRPTNKIHDSAQDITFQNKESEKADQGTRQILRDVSANTTVSRNLALDKTSNSFPVLPSASPSSNAGREQRKALPGIWDFLPSSSPGPASEACYSEVSHLVDDAAPGPLTKTNKRHSLEWACKNDGRTTKRARTSFDLELVQRTGAPPTALGDAPQRPRQRTDKKPRRPSTNVRTRTMPVFNPRNHPQGSLAHSGSFSGCTCLEKDVLDVALALVQLKGQVPSARLARKSI